MKKLFFALLSLLCTIVHAQVEYKVTKMEINLPTIQSDLCKEKIEVFLGKQYGMEEVEVNVKKKKAKVQYYKERIQPNQIRQLIAGIGYDADDVKADPEAYNRLPAECKIPGVLKKEVPPKTVAPPKQPVSVAPTASQNPKSKYQQFIEAKKAQEAKSRAEAAAKRG